MSQYIPEGPSVEFSDPTTGSSDNTQPHKGNPDIKGEVIHDLEKVKSPTQQEVSKTQQQLDENHLDLSLSNKKQQIQQKNQYFEQSSMSGQSSQTYMHMNATQQKNAPGINVFQQKIEEQKIKTYASQSQQYQVKQSIYNFLNIVFKNMIQNAFTNIYWVQQGKVSNEKIGSQCSIGAEENQVYQIPNPAPTQQLLPLDKNLIEDKLKILQDQICRNLENMIREKLDKYRKHLGEQNKRKDFIQDLKQQTCELVVTTIQAYFNPSLRKMLSQSSIQKGNPGSSKSSAQSGLIQLHAQLDSNTKIGESSSSGESISSPTLQNVSNPFSINHGIKQEQSSQKAIHQFQIGHFMAILSQLQKEILPLLKSANFLNDDGCTSKEWKQSILNRIKQNK